MANAVSGFTRNPAREVARQPIAGGVVLFVALAAIVYAKRRTMPTQSTAIGLAAAAAAVVLIAKVARNDAITFVALAFAAFMVWRDPDAPARYVAQIRARVKV